MTTSETDAPAPSNDAPPALELREIDKWFGPVHANDRISFAVPPGTIHGIIGENGAGKSTLFRMISGQDQPDTGTITLGSTVQLGFVDQSRDSLNDDHTVWE